MRDSRRGRDYSDPRGPGARNTRGFDMTDWRSSLRSDPTAWLLDNASAPIRYRVLTELLDSKSWRSAISAAVMRVTAYPRRFF